jgi:hypothetical protein
LVALALYDPANPRWPTAGAQTVAGLLEDSPWHLDIWVGALRPVCYGNADEVLPSYSVRMVLR